MTKKLEHHFVVIPLMSPGHLFPLVDIARLVARRDVKVTIVTTPLNADRVRANLESDIQDGSRIEFQLVQFPHAKVGVPEGCESIDALPSVGLLLNFSAGIAMLQEPVEELFEKLSPTPTCIVADKYIPFVAATSKKFQVPRIAFEVTNVFTLLCDHHLHSSKVYEKFSMSESFVVPGLPDRVVFKKSQLPELFTQTGGQEHAERIKESDEEAYGVVMNTFEELEPEYVKEYKKVTTRKIWCVGPVSLCNKDNSDTGQRGKKDSNKEGVQCLKWLDSWPAKSVIYVAFGTISQLVPEQQMEIGLGLEAAQRPFIWVLRGSYKEELEKLLKEDGLEERVKGRGLIIRDWVPQVSVLSHTSVGAFVTHCGWNSTLEGISCGVPLVTFPLFAEMFYNEKVVVEVLGIGMRTGAEDAMTFWEEKKYGVRVKRENVKEAIEKVMCGDEESERMREKARQYAEKAKKAMEKGGSSYQNMSELIEDITQQVMRLKMK